MTKGSERGGPDILFDPPLLLAGSLKDSGLKEALTFGFARGIDRDRLLRVTEPPIGSSTFDPSVFGQDLFLDELIERCFRLFVRGQAVDGKGRYFYKLLTHPPHSRVTVDFRYAVHAELDDDPERQKWLENAYGLLVDFREALCGAGYNEQRSVGVRRRIDILLSYKRALDALYRACATSQSGLQAVADWVEQVQSHASHEALVRLLDFEDGRSVLETRLQAGYDGTLRRFEIVRVSRVEHRAFPRGPLTRFFTSLLSLLKGYRFSEEDIMSQVLDDVFGQLEDHIFVMLGLMQQIEFYLRAAYFRAMMKKSGLFTCRPRFVEKGEGRRLTHLVNPWLLAKKGERPVPCQIGLEGDESIAIITGPNSGGKTRLLQSIAIAQLLAQVGLPLPAESASLLWIEQLFLSMIEHADADQAEGRLGLELMRIRRVFETSGGNSLILMDELCSGTNPSEGERIFEMVLDLLAELGAQVFITTHFLDFATRLRHREVPCSAALDPKLGEASGKHKLPRAGAIAYLQVELDDAKRPTYQFIPGVAQTSLARNTAARLGVTRDELRSLIAGHLRGQLPSRPT